MMNYKEKFEPKGNKIIHGAGQSLEMFREYWKSVGKYKPLIYMTYIKIQNINKWIDKIQKEVKEFPSLIILFLFELVMNLTKKENMILKILLKPENILLINIEERRLII